MAKPTLKKKKPKRTTPKKPKPRRLTYRELVKRVKQHGIVVIKNKGKGADRMLYKQSANKHYPITFPKKGKRMSLKQLQAIKRKFDLPDSFLQ